MTGLRPQRRLPTRTKVVVGMLLVIPMAALALVPTYSSRTPLVNGALVTEVHGTRHFGGSPANFPFTHTHAYIAVSALLINIVIAAALTVPLRALAVPDGTDETEPADHYAGAVTPEAVRARTPAAV